VILPSVTSKRLLANFYLVMSFSAHDFVCCDMSAHVRTTNTELLSE
jgi:hypothetical protein